jgi:hypothetical protein
MARDYKAEYLARKARAQQRGFTSPRTEQNARRVQRGIPARDYQLEREREQIRAHGAGLDTVAEYRSYRRAQRQGESAERDWTLSYFHISKSKLDRIRRENRQWSNRYAQLQWTKINTYDTFKDSDVHDWSPMRIGYIISFHAAIVNPKTNYESLKDNKKFYKSGPYSRKMGNRSQFYYLVKYTNIESVDEYEARYGTNSVPANGSGVPTP